MNFQRIADALIDVESEKGSRSSKRSNAPMQSKASGIFAESASSKESDLASEAAALKTELKYADIEAKHRKKLEDLKTEMEKTRLQKEAKIYEARLVAIKNEVNLPDALGENKITSDLNPNSGEFTPGLTIPKPHSGVQDKRSKLSFPI